ncbi:DUF5994 family protein [Kitasatospora sp. NPDC053057]|uniref:DUF5994 family protein n=1 Tax=Kitasatospora sp. NPDC053057 TaxID=3364062 RepID=UPI0037CAB2F1
MTAILDRATTPVIPESPLRLSMAPDGVRAGRLDGAWWPRSRDLLVELPSLTAELDERWGRVTRITVNPAQWPLIPRRIPVAGHTVRAGWFSIEQDKHMIMVCSYIPRRLNLLVVPPRTNSVDAARLMTEAADPANTRSASELLAARAGAREAQPEARSDFMPLAVAPADGAREAERRAGLARLRADSWPAPDRSASAWASARWGGPSYLPIRGGTDPTHRSSARGGPEQVEGG